MGQSPPSHPRPAMSTPEQYAQQKAAASGSSFYYAFLFLPRERRAAITAFYAFCREVDDVVDEVSDPGVAQAKLAWWQDEVAKAFAGQPSHPVMQALMPHVPAHGLRQDQLQAVIEGCQMDLEQARYADFRSLQRYCHLVAGVVGEVAAQIFGQTGRAPRSTRTSWAWPSSSPTSSATWARTPCAGASTCRSASCSSSRSRPMRSPARILRPLHRPDALSGRARPPVLRPGPGPAARVDRRAQKPGLMMASIYRTLLREIEADGFQVLHQRTSLTPLRKFWLAWKMQALGLM